jgi:predicted naringenin-chalcone synthase
MRLQGNTTTGVLGLKQWRAYSKARAKAGLSLTIRYCSGLVSSSLDYRMVTSLTIRYCSGLVSSSLDYRMVTKAGLSLTIRWRISSYS